METQTHTTIATFAASIRAHCGAFIVQGSPVFAVLILLRQKWVYLFIIIYLFFEFV